MGTILGAILAYFFIREQHEYAEGDFRKRQVANKANGKYPSFTQYDETPNQEERWKRNAR